MKTIAALLLMTTAACAQSNPPIPLSPIEELRFQLLMPQIGTATINGFNPRTMAQAIVELADRPQPPQYTTCFQLEITVNAAFDAETSALIKKAFEDVAPKIREACSAAGVP